MPKIITQKKKICMAVHAEKINPDKWAGSAGRNRKKFPNFSYGILRLAYRNDISKYINSYILNKMF